MFLKLFEKQKSSRSFTIPELLVALSIAAILMTALIILSTKSYSTAKARDSKRVSEINTIRTALQLYYMDNNQYPTSTQNEEWCSLEAPAGNSRFCPDLLTKLQPYLQAILSDPLFGKGKEPDSNTLYSYQYISTSSGEGYKLHIDLETRREPYEVGSLLGNKIVYGPGGGAVCGDTLVDSRDGKEYATVQIGTQCWMKQGLNIGTRIDWTSNQTNNGTIEKYCYGDSDANCTSNNSTLPDGGLYQWGEAMQYAASCNGTGESQPVCASPVQGICPVGWHIPSHYEYVALERAVCTSASCATDFPYNTITTGYRGTNEGAKLKPGGTSDFQGNLAGYRKSTGFADRTTFGFFWSSLQDSSPLSWARALDSGYAMVYRYYYPKTFGFSVRCLKD